MPATEAIRRGFRAILHPNENGGPDLYEEYLDAARFPGPAHLETMASLLEKKYSGRTVDVIVAVGPTALDFSLQHKAKLFPAAKLVFAGIREERAGDLVLPPDSLGIVSKLNPAETLELALDLQPKARQGYVITGSAAFDKSWEAIARTKLASFEPRLSLTFLAGLPLESVLERVSAVPPDSIVIHLSMFEDGTGRTFVPREVAGKIASAANAPVYSVYDTYIGQGIVGGYMDTFDAVGLAVGSLVQKILAGEQPTGGAIREAETHKFVVDWRQMSRWRLDAANLPQSTEIRFREPSVWDQYKSYILAFAAVLLLQSALLILGGIRSRKLASQLAAESKERMELAVTSADIGLWNWNAKSNTVWTSERCKELLMLDGRASLTRDEFIGRLRVDDRPIALKRMADALASGLPCVAEYPIDLPDGSERWILSRALAKGGHKDNGPRDHILGVVMDITERKRGEAEVLQHRRELTHLTRVSVVGALSGALAHELNQPLTAILSNAQAAVRLISRDPVDAVEIGLILQDIVDDDKRAGHVIQHLRSLLKKDSATRTRVQINELITVSLAICHSDLILKGVPVSKRLAADLPEIDADPVQIQQVLLNLIMNACEAMNGKPAKDRLLLIKSERRDALLRISVVDSGDGIPAEAIKELYQPFFTTKSLGLGLGLP
ncbi:ATP-binding protein, partial [Mesorhizobium sp. YR577]|uniref:sensor histidine kinase n=1 Tax=Mesorhizobium sp. YR577 TaxID=1884373 RepID=UPI001FCD27B1